MPRPQSAPQPQRAPEGRPVWREPYPVRVADSEDPMRCEVTVREVKQPYALLFVVSDPHAGLRVTPADIRREVEREVGAGKSRHGRSTGGPGGRRADEAMLAWLTRGELPSRGDFIVWLLWRMQLRSTGAEAGVVLEFASPDLLPAAEATLPLPSLPAYGADLEPAAVTMPGYDVDPPPPETLSGDDDDDEIPPPPMSPAPAPAPGFTSSGPVTRMERETPAQIAARLTRTAPAVAPPPAFTDGDEYAPPAPAPAAATAEVKGRSTRLSRETKERADWSDHRWRMAMELRRSKLDLEHQAELQRKKDVVMKVHAYESARKFHRFASAQDHQRHEQRWERQAMLDAIEMHRHLETLERESKATDIATQKRVERASWAVQPFKERRGRWKKGAYIGPGPLPAAARFEADKKPIPFVWDRHGRRHHISEAGRLKRASPVETAMEKLKQAADDATEWGADLRAPFRRMDKDGSRTLSLSEMGMGLRELGVVLSPDELSALYSHFDPNGNGSVGMGEFEWAFFNRRKFVEQFAEANGGDAAGRSDSQMRALFFEADEQGRGRLNRANFERLLSRLGVQQGELAIDKFDTNGDGWIDFEEFQAFVRGLEAEVATAGEEGGPKESKDRSRAEAAVAEARAASRAEQSKPVALRAAEKAVAEMMEEQRRLTELLATLDAPAR